MSSMQDNNTNFLLSQPDHPLSKRRRFTPNTLFSPFADFDQHTTFPSPLLLNNDLNAPSPLPEELQADLLQVGMRIRKAVPEGYKTHKFTPRPFFNMQRLSPQLQAAITGSNNITDSPDLSPYSNKIHRVGAMAMQPIATATFCGINLSALPPGGDVPSGNLWMRPSVGDQGLWNSYSTSHKRGLELDEDDLCSDGNSSQDWSPETPTLIGHGYAGMPIDYFNIDVGNGSDEENMYDASPLTKMQGHGHRRQNSFPFKQTEMGELNVMGMGSTARKMAKPRSRVRNALAAASHPMQFNPFANLVSIPEQQVDMDVQAVMAEQQQQQQQQVFAHQRMMSCGMEMNMNSNDFGDATFLQRREDVEMDCS